MTDDERPPSAMLTCDADGKGRQSETRVIVLIFVGALLLTLAVVALGNALGTPTRVCRLETTAVPR